MVTCHFAVVHLQHQHLNRHLNTKIFYFSFCLQNLGIEEALLNLEIMQPEIPPDAVQGKNLCGLPLLENSSLVGVFVEHIVSPNQFYIRICSKETSEMLEDTMIEMR